MNKIKLAELKRKKAIAKRKAQDKFIGSIIDLNQSISLMQSPDVKVEAQDLTPILDEIKAIKDKAVEAKVSVDVTSEMEKIKLDTDGLATQKDIIAAQEVLNRVADRLLQEPEDEPSPSKYTPVRRVIRRGGKLMFDDTIGGGGGSGGGGTVVNVDTDGLATEAKQDDIITAIGGISGGSTGKPTDLYGICNIDSTDSTYKYFGFQDKDGNWYIMRKTLATAVFLYTAGTSGYSTAWTARAGKTYADYATTF